MAFIRLVIAIIVQFPGFCSLAGGGFRIFQKHGMKNCHRVGMQCELYRNTNQRLKGIQLLFNEFQTNLLF